MKSNIECIEKNFGFGCMRLPMKGDKVDYDEFNRMIDTFMDAGFNYFDTAHMYVDGKSETALRECLVSRYPRESYVLTDKLSTSYFDNQEQIRPLFESQLKTCGVEYFDFYLMHAQNAEIYEKFKKCKAYETSLEFLREGKIKHFGISFHDKASVLEQILTEYPQIEIVQLQFNYIDYDDAAVQGRECYEVCCKHGKPVIVMEPVKGGSLANLPDEAKQIFDELQGGSYASYAIRFAASFENVILVLSGMSNMTQVEDNLSFMTDFKPLDDREMAAIMKVCDVLRRQDIISCTACRYCTEGCPSKISIPDLFACMNAKKQYKDWNSSYYYNEVHTVNNGKASACVECGKCEKVCPQHLNIRELLKQVALEFER